MAFARTRSEHIRAWLNLDNSRLRELAVRLLAEDGADKERRWDLLESTLLRLGRDHPREVLDILSKIVADVRFRINNRPGPEGLMIAVLREWAKSNPTDAWNWFRKMHADPSQPVRKDAADWIIRSAAAKDVRLALRLLDEASMNPTGFAKDLFARQGRSREDGLDRLAALREWTDGITDESVRMRVLRDGLQAAVFGPWGVPTKFEDATAMLDSASITEDERRHLTQFGRLLNSIDFAECGEWLGWLGRGSPPDGTERTVFDLAHEWAGRDHDAVVRWLGRTDVDSRTRIFAATGLLHQMWAVDYPDTEVDRALEPLCENDRFIVIGEVCKRNYGATPDKRARLDAWAERHGTRIDSSN